MGFRGFKKTYEELKCKSMGQAAYNIVEHYIENNNVANFEDLKQIFKDKSFKEPQQLLAKTTEISDDLDKSYNGKYRKRNYWVSSRGFFKIGDTEFGVSTQWVSGESSSALNFEEFQKLVSRLGYSIEEVERY